MEDKYKKTLENVLILADEEVIEICTEKSYFDTFQTRAPDSNLNRENLCKLLAKPKKCPRFGLNIKEKRLRKKIRHYTMKIVNFNTILLQDKPKNEYYVVFYRSGLSFNANIANFYFSGVTNLNPSVKRRKNKKVFTKMLCKRVVKKRRTLSFRNYLRRSIKQQFYKYLDGEHSLISVHAVFTIDNPSKSKIFITRDIEKYSDIDKFIKMIDSFDPMLKYNVNKKVEASFKKHNIPMNNVLVVAQINQSRKNLFIQWNDKLVRSLNRKNMKTPATQLINTNIMNLRLDHISFSGVESTNVKNFVNIIEELVSKNIQDENIEMKLEKQLNSCKTFIACLDAFETSQMSDMTKVSRSSGYQTVGSISKQEPISETTQVGDTENSKMKEVSVTSDEKVQGILSKIDTLQKRIRTLVKTSPSLHKDADIQHYLRKKSVGNEKENLTAKPKIESKQLQEIEKEMDVTLQLDVENSKFSKPEMYRKDSKDIQSNLVKIERFLKQDFQESKLQIEGLPTINYQEGSKVEAPKALLDFIPKEISNIEKLLKNKLENPDPEFDKFFKVLQKNANSEGFKKIVQKLDEKYQNNNVEIKPTETLPKPVKPPVKTSDRPKSAVSKRSSKESHSLKSIFAAKNVKLRPRSKQKRQKKPEKKPSPAAPKAPAAIKPSEPTVIKLENFIDQILKITKTYFADGSREEPPKKTSPDCSEMSKTNEPSISKTNTSTIITIKKYTEMEETKSEMSTNTVNSFMRKVKMAESAVQTERTRKKRLHTKLTQTDVDTRYSASLRQKRAVAMETQTDISIHKHAQIKFSGMSMQLSKNVTITNVRKNVINVRNICEETSEAVKRLLEKETVFNEDSPNLKQVVETISEDLRKGNNKAEILGQIKNTLENVIDRFKKSTLLISKATNFTDMTENLKKIMVPSELPVAKKSNFLKPIETEEPTSIESDSSSSRKEVITSNLTMSLKLLKNLSEVTKTIRKNPREAARKLHGIRNELMHYRKTNLYNVSTSKVSSRLYLPKTSSTLTSKQSKGRMRRATSLFPKNVALNIYGYPASSTDIKPDLNELNRIFTPKTRSICNTELSIIKHRDRHADHIASHLGSNHSTSKSKYGFDFKKFRSKSAQLKSHKCQMYIAKTYKKSYANSLSQTACTPSNVPQIQTAIENPLVPKIVRPVRWKHPLPESPQLSNLSLKDVKPFNSEYPRKDHVSPSTHSYLDRLLESPEKHAPMIKCSDNDCSKCSDLSCYSTKTKDTTDDSFANMSKGNAHFKTENRKIIASEAIMKFDFGKFMLDPVRKSINLPEVNFTVCPVNVLQNKNPESPKSNPPINKKLCEVKNNQNKVQKSIQQAIIQNQEKFQAMQRILTLSKPQDRKITNPSSSTVTSSLNFSKSSSIPPKIKSTHTKKFSKINDASTSKSKSFSSTQRQNLVPQQTHSIQTAVATYKTVKQVQPHPKLKQLQQHQIPLKPKHAHSSNSAAKKQSVEPNTSASFNKKYSDVSLSSLKTIAKDDKQPKSLTQNLKNVKRSQEDIQKYIALVEQKFLKTFSLNEQEKEGAYKNLVDEIQGMLNVLNSKDKNEKKMKIKKSLEKLTKETEPPTIEVVPPKKEKLAPPQTKCSEGVVKKNTKTESTPDTPGELVSYAKTLESVEKSLKVFQNNCEENNKISEAATEKLLNWKTTKSTHEDFSKTSSKASLQYTLSEKERIIDEKLTEYPATAATANKQTSVVVIKDPISMAAMDRQTSESEAVIGKKKNSDFSGPTLLSTTLNSSDSLIETDETINYSGLSMNSFSKLNPKQNLRLNKSQSVQKYKKLIKIIQESPNSTDTSLIPFSNDNTEDGYLTITEFSGSNSSSSSNSNSDLKITPLVEFSVEMYLCDYLHYSYRCQPPLISVIPHIYHKIHYTDKIEAKPITQAYQQKYSSSIKQDSYDQSIYEYPVSSSLNFSNMLSQDSYNIEQEFLKNYSDKLFTESINTILSKNSDFTLRNIFGNGSSSSERLVQKTSSNFYEYVDLLSNISRIFIEPEVTQFYQPKFISYPSVPERETKTYYIAIIFCRVQFAYSVFNPSKCNLLSSASNFTQNSAIPEAATKLSATPMKLNPKRDLSLSQSSALNSTLLTQNSSHLSVTQNTVSEISDLTLTQFSSTSVSTADLFSEAPYPNPIDLAQKLSQNIVVNVDQKSMTSEPYYSVKSSITKFEFFNENVEIQTITRQPHDNVEQTTDHLILIQNVENPTKDLTEDEPNVEDLTDGEGNVEDLTEDEGNVENIIVLDEAEAQIELDSRAVKKLSFEELYVENVCFASKKSSTYFNVDNLDNNFNIEINFNEDEAPEVTQDTNNKIVETVELKDDFKRLSNKLAQQSNELGQLLLNNKNQHQQRRLPKLMSVKNFNAHKFISNPVLNRFDYSYDCNYDLKLTISPKYLATNFPSATCMQILPLLKNRIGSLSHSLTMKIELNHFKSSRSLSRNTSFKKPKRNVIVFNKTTQKSESLSNKFSLIQVQKKEMYTESYKMILIFLYVSIFSFIFICMTLNYKCD